jgi:hypothetical protein
MVTNKSNLFSFELVNIMVVKGRVGSRERSWQENVQGLLQNQLQAKYDSR